MPGLHRPNRPYRLAFPARRARLAAHLGLFRPSGHFVYSVTDRTDSIDQPDQTDGTDPIDSIDSIEWYALYTRPRHEKAVAKELLRRGIEAFVPLREVLSHWQDRQKRVQRPLFPGYLFVHIEPSRRGEVVRTAGAVSLVGVHGVLTPIPDEQIAAIRTICRTKRPFSPAPCHTEGERIRVVRGPLAGLQGRASELEGRPCLVVSIDLLQQSVAVELDVDSTIPLLGHDPQ